MREFSKARKYRVLGIFVVWVLLLYRVVTTVLEDGYYTSESLMELALLAWIGGLAANELIRHVIFKWKEFRA
jgi:hypothetical protein